MSNDQHLEIRLIKNKVHSIQTFAVTPLKTTDGTYPSCVNDQGEVSKAVICNLCSRERRRESCTVMHKNVFKAQEQNMITVLIGI